MSKQRVIFLKGIPASGKTTWAKKRINKDDDFMRVNKDDIRKMIGGQWSPEKEELVKELEYELVLTGLQLGQSIIIDDTNFNPEHESAYRMLATEFEAEFEVKEFDTLLITCLARNAKREGRSKMPESVIIEMYKKNYGRK